jgi:hypothetical protein
MRLAFWKAPAPTVHEHLWTNWSEPLPARVAIVVSFPPGVRESNTNIQERRCLYCNWYECRQILFTDTEGHRA